MTNAKKHKTKAKNGTISNLIYVLRYCHGHVANVLLFIKVTVWRFIVTSNFYIVRLQ